MDFLKLTSDKLDPTAISELVVHESCGAVAMFAGTTRDNFDGKQVVSLQYEAYDEMAKKEMASICYEIRQRWPDVKHIAMHHRLGLVPVKEASVVIAISSPHRKSSLEALPFALDELKKSVPVWKKEFYKEDKGDDINKRALVKRQKLNFEDCRIVDELKLSEALVQVKADGDEVQRRIEAFIELKREEINRNNLNDFIEAKDNFSCARVASNVYRIEDSKGHLRIKRVKNITGPNDAKTLLDETAQPEPLSTAREMNYCSIDERLQDVENYMKFGSSSIPKDIYQRLKIIEDQISILKTVSPEYSQFVISKDSAPKRKVEYSLSDLDKIIASMEGNS